MSAVPGSGDDDLMNLPFSPGDGVVPRTAVIGDVGGHLEDLRLELRRLGADPSTGRLPEGLTVVQVGDLVHRGPDSTGVVDLVDGYLRTQPEQWVQLVGNHEAQYLRDPAFEWPEQLGGATADTLRRWWADGRMRVATSVRSADETFLITHAGLTKGFWSEVLGRLVDASRVAAALNSLIGTHEDVLFHAGQMLNGGRPDLIAGPVWASAGTELVPSWLESTMPFSQVHGHATVADRRGRRSAVGDEVARRTSVDVEARHESTHLAGGRIIGIDPGHGREARRPWRALEIETERLEIR